MTWTPQTPFGQKGIYQVPGQIDSAGLSRTIYHLVLATTSSSEISWLDNFRSLAEDFASSATGFQQQEGPARLASSTTSYIMAAKSKDGFESFGRVK